MMDALALTLIIFACVIAIGALTALMAVRHTEPTRGYVYQWIDTDSDDPGFRQTRFVARPVVGNVFAVDEGLDKPPLYYQIYEVDHLNATLDARLVFGDHFRDDLETK